VSRKPYHSGGLKPAQRQFSAFKFTGGMMLKKSGFVFGVVLSVIMFIFVLYNFMFEIIPEWGEHSTGFNLGRSIGNFVIPGIIWGWTYMAWKRR